MVKGCRKQNAKLRFSATPFCFGEYVLNEKGEYHTVIGCTPVEQFGSIIGDIDKFYAGSVMLDVLRNSCNEGEDISQNIVVVLKYLKTLAYDDVDTKLALVSFFIDFLKVTGYELSFSECKVCRTKNMGRKFLSFSAGGVVCLACSSREDEPISNECWGLLKSIVEGIPLGVLRYEDNVKREALLLLGSYFARLFSRKLASLNQYLDISKSV